MNSFFARLYLDLKEHIKSEVPMIQNIEQDFRQYKLENWQLNVSFPTLLIDFPNTKYSQESGLSQLGEVKIKFKLLNYLFDQNNEDTLADQKVTLELFEIEDQLIKALQGWKGNYFQPLIRLSSSTKKRKGLKFQIRKLVFNTIYEEEF